jgi:hypothetical protein
MMIESSIVVIAVSLLSVLFVRKKDLPAPEPVAPAAHLHDRKRAIHESLRDLQFDFRTGKLSESDYQSGKISLQSELAVILLEIKNVPANRETRCASCGETSRAMKFCGNCGKALA